MEGKTATRRGKTRRSPAGWDARCVQVIAQGHLFRVKMRYSAALEGGGARGTVSDFSANSRKRMLETLARVDLERAGFTCFITLTYPDRNGPPSAGATERDRQTFLKRIRRGWPDASAVWRREWEARESGAFMGVSFPHYHLLCFGLPFVHYEHINAMWRKVVRHDGYLRTEIRGIRSWRQACYYVAKYMAKPTPGGARPARQGGPAAGGGRSLVYGTYLTGEGEKQSGRKIGRSWGIFNREKVPWGELKTVTLAAGPWLEEAKARGRAVWPGMNDYPTCGFMLFVDDSHAWLEDMRRLEAADRAEGMAP
jgi:hypothetical protein